MPLNTFTSVNDTPCAPFAAEAQELLTNHNQAPYEEPEILFSVATNPKLAINLKQRNGLAIEFFEHRVAREPTDLRSHVQRVYLYSRMKNADGLYGALVDLFIALNSKGYLIRKRMLSHAEYLLNAEQFQALTRKLESGLRASDAMPLSSSSVLSRGLIGINNFISFITNDDSAISQHADVVEEAEELLDAGQIDEARIILEQAILEEPWRKDLHDDLLEIYLATRDLEHCDAMYEKLSDKFIPDHYAWSSTIERINQFVGAA